MDKRNAKKQKIEQFSQAFAQLPDSILITDSNFNIISINKPFEEMYGYTLEELAGKKPDLLNVEPMAEAIQQDIYDTVSRNDIWRGSALNIRKDGSTFLCDMTISTIVDEHGKPFAYIGTQKDITRQRKAEEALKASRDLYHGLFNNMKSGVAVYEAVGDGEDFVFVDFNRAGEKIEGVEKGDIIGKKVTEAFPRVKEFGLFEVFQRVWKTGSPEFHPISFHTDERISRWRDNFVYKLPSGEVVVIYSDETDRKRAEEELRLERDNLNHIFEAMEDGIYIANQQYDIQYVNPVLKKDFGIYEGRKCYEYFHDRTEVCPWCKNPDVFAGKTVRWEWYSFKNQRTYDLIDTPLKNPDGSISKLEIFRDITERKQAEDLIKTQRDLAVAINSVTGLDEGLRLCFEVACRVSGMDCGGVYLFDESGASDLVYHEGLSPEFVKGASHYELQLANVKMVMEGKPLYTQHLDLDVNFTGTEKREGLRAIAVIPIKYRDEVIGCLNIASHFNDEVPHFSRNALETIAAGIGSSIVSLKAEEEIRKFRTISDRAVHGNVIVDLQDNITYINDYFAQIHGYTVDKLLGRNLSVFHNEKQLEAVRQINESLIEKGSYSPTEVWHTHKDGTEFPMLMSGIVMRDENGNPKYMAATAIDITEHKRLEEQLQIRQRMDSLGTLAGGIGHDFNNLLAAIMGYMDLFKFHDSNLTGTQRKYLNEVIKATSRAAELVKQFQSLSKTTVSEKTSIDIYETADEVFNLLRKTTDRIVKKEMDLERGKFYVTGSASELHQVLLNLGTNAFQAIEERGAKEGDYIKIRAKEYRAGDSDRTGLAQREYVHIFFEDNGKGMSDEVQRKAFDPLFTTRDKSGQRGQGLGLAMVYNIITGNHEGYISIESEEGKGTTMHIYLQKATPPEKAKPAGVRGVYGGEETVLVIDDEEMVQNLAKDVLVRYGYNVLTADDGIQGLDIYSAKQDSIDLVLLDLIMPKMSGQMVLDNMLKINPKAKVIISSGQSDAKTRKGILSKAKGYVNKPYRIADLAQTVRTVLDM